MADTKENLCKVLPSLFDANVPIQPRRLFFLVQVTNRGNSNSSNSDGTSYGYPDDKNLCKFLKQYWHAFL